MLRDDKFSTADLNDEVRKIWEKKSPNITYSKNDTENANTFRAGVTVDMNDIQSPEILAEGLVNQILEMFKDMSDQTFTAYITTESVLMDIIKTPELDKTSESHVYAYYTGDTELTKPNVRAWLVLRGTFPDAPNGKSYMMRDGERVEATY